MQVVKSFLSNDPVQNYINQKSLRLTNEQIKLIERTRKTPGSYMLSSIDQIQFFQLLLKAINARRVIELGTFTGYTTLTMALALPDDARIVACDISDRYIATDIWKEAGVDHKIDIQIGPAVDTLKSLLKAGMENKFDFIFIDADKQAYPDYYELSLRLARKGGIIAIDNVLWGGAVADDRVQDSDTNILRRLNDHIKNDSRVEISMLNIGDGVTFCYKK